MAECISCGDVYPPRRAELGYNTCLSCGDFAARQVKHTVVPMNKSNYMLVTNQAELKMLNPKRVGE
jgi:predicted  nucleic acid-binding Zn-ribbon protein